MWRLAARNGGQECHPILTHVCARALHSSLPSAKRWTTQKGDRVKNWRKHLSKKRQRRERKARAEQAALVEAREEACQEIFMPSRTAEEAEAQFREYGAVAQAIATLRTSPVPASQRTFHAISLVCVMDTMTFAAAAFVPWSHP